jgi:hypothetical protein
VVFHSEKAPKPQQRPLLISSKHSAAAHAKLNHIEAWLQFQCLLWKKDSLTKNSG